jgi:hypothetical protein
MQISQGIFFNFSSWSLRLGTPCKNKFHSTRSPEAETPLRKRTSTKAGTLSKNLFADYTSNKSISLSKFESFKETAM